MKRALALVAVAAFTAGLVLLGATADAATNTYTASPAGTNEIPPNDAGYTGTVTITIDTVTFEVCVDATLDTGEETVIANHIHVGTAAENGPIVVNFGNSLSTCVTSDSATVGAIVANPAGYYYNAHTPMFQAGALRDQLAQVVDTTTTSSTTSTTARPAVSAGAVAADPAFTG